MASSSQLFYFNGFNSAILDDYSGNPKIVAVADYARQTGFEFIPVSVRFRRAREQSSEILERVSADAQRVVFCGSSMGGWYARILQLLLAGRRPGLRSEAIAFNPAFDLVNNQHHLAGPQQNHVTGETYEWTASHSRQLVKLELAVDFDEPLPYFVFVDKGDELIPWEASRDRHEAMSHFHAFEGGCHSFDHYAQALTIFDSACADKLIR